MSLKTISSRQTANAAALSTIGSSANATLDVILTDVDAALLARCPVTDQTRAPLSSDSGYTLGTIWVNTAATTAYDCTANGVGTSVWIQITTSSGGGSTCVIAEYATGSSTTYNTTYTPSTGEAAWVIINGLTKYVTTHFTMAGTTITFKAAPATAPLVIYVTDSRLIQSNLGTGTGALTSFSTPVSLNMVAFLDGLVADPTSETRLSSSLVEFFSAPGIGQSVYFSAMGLGQFLQGAMTGTIGGGNVTFTLPYSPSKAGAAMVFLNGRFIPQISGAYGCSISGSTVTFGTAPVAGQAPYALVFNG